MGRKGKAFTFVTKNDVPNLRDLIHKKKITPCWIGEDPLKKDSTHQKQETRRKGKRPFRRYSGKGKQNK
jgi:ATP-dependent RNA helicase DeaD